MEDKDKLNNKNLHNVSEIIPLKEHMYLGPIAKFQIYGISFLCLH